MSNYYGSTESGTFGRVDTEDFYEHESLLTTDQPLGRVDDDFIEFGGDLKKDILANPTPTPPLISTDPSKLSPSPFTICNTLIILICTVIIVTIAVIEWGPQATSSSLTDDSTDTANDDAYSSGVITNMTTTLWTLKNNKYTTPSANFHPSGPPLTYDFLNKYDAIIEPGQPMELYVYSSSSTRALQSKESSTFQEGKNNQEIDVTSSDKSTNVRRFLEDGPYYKVEVTSCPLNPASSCQCETFSLSIDTSTSSMSSFPSFLSSSSSSSTTTSSYLSHDCTPLEEFSIKLEAFIEGPSDGSTSDIAMGTAVCMYVRREIRSLSADDLSDTMNAMYELYQTDDKHGQTMYGNNYHDITYFTSAHYFGSAGLDADYIHGGQGFLPQHAKFSNVFELAMQSVNNKVTLPYWDYTIDSQYNSLSDAFVFQPDVFGSLTLPANDRSYWYYSDNDLEDGIIPDGRWARLEVDLNSDYITESDLATSPFGYLRAPWSANPSKYILRFPVPSWNTTIGGLPSCSDFYEWFQKESLYDMLRLADYDPHTPTHWTIGNFFGCDILDTFETRGWISTKSDKMMLCKTWIIKLKTFFRAGLITTPEEGACTASENLANTTCAWVCDDSQKDELITALKDEFDNILKKGQMSASDWEAFYTWYCSGDAFKIIYGDHREPGSPKDPSFWPIHTTLERALQARLLAGGGFQNMDWLNGTDANACSSTSCYIDGIQDEYEECCWGHGEDDGFPNFITGERYKNTIWIKNGEFIDMTNPTNENYAMPYVYDTFTWSHCAGLSDGDIDSFLESL